jgi:DNA polymerase-3 subunit epsilon
MTTVAVIDFETTGLSPTMGDRATEIAVVLVEGDQVVDRFQSLMYAGVRISAFIEAYTGISNEMIATAPKAENVMADASRFVNGRPMVAHNASFDRRFWMAEMERADRPGSEPFACTLLLSRRLYPEAPNYKLGSLASFHALPSSGKAHRAMADAETAAYLLGRIRTDLRSRFGVPEPRHELLMKLQACAKKGLARMIEQHLAKGAAVAAPAALAPALPPAFTPREREEVAEDFGRSEAVQAPV